MNIHLLRDNHGLDLAQAAGFGFVRMDMQWANVERGADVIVSLLTMRCFARWMPVEWVSSGFSIMDILITGAARPGIQRTWLHSVALPKRQRVISEAVMFNMRNLE